MSCQVHSNGHDVLMASRVINKAMLHIKVPTYLFRADQAASRRVF